MQNKPEIRFGLCSNLNIELKYRRMNSKNFQELYLDQLEVLRKLGDECLAQNIDILFVVGNVFARYNPQNRSLHAIRVLLEKLKRASIEVVLIPGPMDMPLQLSKDDLSLRIFGDNPTTIGNATDFANLTKRHEQKNGNNDINLNKENNDGALRNNKNENTLKNGKSDHLLSNGKVILLSGENPWRDNGICKSSVCCTKSLKRNALAKFQLFSTPNPLISPAECNFAALQPKNHDTVNVFFQPTTGVFDNEIEILKQVLGDLNHTGLDVFVYGGIFPRDSIEVVEYDFEILTAPPIYLPKISRLSKLSPEERRTQVGKIHFYSITPANSPADGGFGPKNIITLENEAKMSPKKYFYEEINVANVPVKLRNKKILNLIEENAGEHTIAQINLFGTIPIQEYHNLDLYKLTRPSYRKGYYGYFELNDDIDFENFASEDTEELTIKSQIQAVIEEKLQHAQDDQQKFDILQGAKKMIEKDLEESR